MDEMEQSEYDSIRREQLKRLRAEEVRYRAEIEAEARMRVAAASPLRRFVGGLFRAIGWGALGVFVFLFLIVVFA